MNSKRYLSRTEAAEYVRMLGLPCAKTTLAKFAVIGGGPTFYRFGARVVYDRRDLDVWIASRLTAPIVRSAA